MRSSRSPSCVAIARPSEPGSVELRDRHAHPSSPSSAFSARCLEGGRRGREGRRLRAPRQSSRVVTRTVRLDLRTARDRCRAALACSTQVDVPSAASPPAGPASAPWPTTTRILSHPPALACRDPRPHPSIGRPGRLGCNTLGNDETSFVCPCPAARIDRHPPFRARCHRSRRSRALAEDSVMSVSPRGSDRSLVYSTQAATRAIAARLSLTWVVSYELAAGQQVSLRRAPGIVPRQTRHAVDGAPAPTRASA